MAANNLVLVSLVELAEMAAPVPDSDDEVLVPIGTMLDASQRAFVQPFERNSV